MKTVEVILVWLLILLMAVPSGVMAQETQLEETPFRPEELDQMLAPIALYPDSLLAQMLTAATYPLEIVQADRFVRANTELKGEKLMEAAKDKDWDPSVKAMLQFPDVLAMMSEQLDWTTKLGDAFLAQQREVMDAVQSLRKKAEETGNLISSKEQVVKVEPQTQTIIVESANPQVVYVPAYNPTVVYGTWWYPAYPPYYYYPPGYVAAATTFTFFAGVAVGAAWGAWGCNWRRGDVNINVNRYNNFTKNNYVNAKKYQLDRNVKNQTWRHNPEHRKSARYRDQGTAQRYGQQRPGDGKPRGDYRGFDRSANGRGSGRADTRDLDRGGRREGAPKGTGGRVGDRSDITKADLGSRAPQKGGTRDLSGGSARDRSRSGSRDTAFSGAGRGGRESAASHRGQSSRSYSSPGRGGYRGGGGRAGGGGRGGGRR